MLNSMTGYGEADGQLDGIGYFLEIRTVNNRYLKTIIRLPETVAFLEDGIERQLREHLSRGTVNFVLKLKGLAANALFEIDRAALEAVVRDLSDLEAPCGVHRTLEVGSLLTLPGIVKPAVPDAEQAERIREFVLGLSAEALGKLGRMRATEGRFLEDDLKAQCDKIAEDLERIRARSSTVVVGYATRLKRRVDELLAEAKLSLDAETLAREVAILADRSDISEEIARLDSHLQQFVEICRTNGQAGRRLDFLCQEMLREANTLASKACDTEIARSVVDIKCWIDRLKEQIQNVE